MDELLKIFFSYLLNIMTISPLPNIEHKCSVHSNAYEEPLWSPHVAHHVNLFSETKRDGGSEYVIMFPIQDRVSLQVGQSNAFLSLKSGKTINILSVSTAV